jgi:hypothetical protein
MLFYLLIAAVFVTTLFCSYGQRCQYFSLCLIENVCTLLFTYNRFFVYGFSYVHT